jgi:hypothetical protein
LTFRLTFAHKPDIRLGAIALVVGIEYTGNTLNHLVGSFGVSVWLLGKVREIVFLSQKALAGRTIAVRQMEIEKSEGQRDNE